jgi:hypothetical protein
MGEGGRKPDEGEQQELRIKFSPLTLALPKGEGTDPIFLLNRLIRNDSGKALSIQTRN